MSSSAAPCQLTFRLGRAETAPGEGVLVVGGHHSFGNWDPVSGLKMTTDEATYPAWTAQVEVPRAAGRVEFKYVIDRRASGEALVGRTWGSAQGDLDWL